MLLVNTCTVRQHAEDRAFSEIGRLKKWKAQKPGRKIVVTGCAAERTKEYLEDRFPYVDLVVGAKSIEDFGALVEGLLERRPDADDLDYAVPSTSDKVSAFVTIMRGCNYSCTYCIVPYVRGRESYHPMEQILAEVRDRVREGAREIMLLGQTVNSYHRDGNRGQRNGLCRSARSCRRCRRRRANSLHEPASLLHDGPRDRGDGRSSGGLRGIASAGAVRFDRDAEEDAAELHARKLPGTDSEAARAPCRR